jgi:hypothetical protein
MRYQHTGPVVYSAVISKIPAKLAGYALLVLCKSITKSFEFGEKLRLVVAT